MTEENILHVYEPGDDVEGHMLGVQMPREELEAALATEPTEPLDLLLSVELAGDGAETPAVETFALEFPRSELESLLTGRDGEFVSFALDRRELQDALTGDVEAHGFGKKAIVVSAIAGALISTPAAFAGGNAKQPVRPIKGGKASIVQDAKVLHGFQLRRVHLQQAAETQAQHPSGSPHKTFGPE